jgi:hypothetical protein
MSANLQTDQLAAAAAATRRNVSVLHQATGDELARRLSGHLGAVDPTVVGEVLLWVGQFIDGMADSALERPGAITAAQLGRGLSSAVTLAGERLYTGGAL